MKKIFQNSFLQGSFYLMAANVVIGGLNYVFNIVSGRLLGPEGYGNVTTLFAYLAVLTIPLVAISNLIIQRVGLRGENKKRYVWAVEEWTYLQYRKYWYLILLLLICVPVTPQLTNLTPLAAYSIIPLVLLSIIATVYEGLLTGLQKFFLASLIGVISVFIKLVGALLGFVLPNPLAIVLIVFNISIVVKIVLNKLVLNADLKIAKQEALQKINKTVTQVVMTRQFLLTIGSILSIALINNIDMIYAKRIFTAENAGLFAGWTLFSKIIIYAFGPLLTMSYVFFTNKKHGVYHHMVLIASFLLLTTIGVALNIGYGMFDRALINILLGEKFLPLKPFIEWAALFGIGYVMVMFMNNYFLAKERKATLILPIMTALYFPLLFYFGRELGSLIFFNTIYMFAILILYLLVFVKDKLIFLTS